MKILLIQPPPLFDEKITSLVKYAPMGLITIASFVREKNENLDIKIYDANVGENLSIENIISEIEKFNPNILGLTAMTNNISSALEISEETKKKIPNIKIVLGGVHATLAPKEVLKNKSVDFIIIGEGEEAFNELLKNINNPEKFSEIKNLGYKKNNELFINEKRDLIRDLDVVPMPAYDLIEMKNYRSPYGQSSAFVSMLRSRGCPFRCIYCGVQNMFGRIYRVQSPEKTIEEIKYLQDKFNIEEIGFKDSEFIINKKNVSDLCDLIIEKNIKFDWTCNARVDCGDYELFKKMKNAGCHTISFGAESGDQHILDILKKDITIEQIERAIGYAKKAGIKISVNFIIGSPYETAKTIQKTIDLAIKLNPDYVFFSFATPFPGTELRSMAEENNWIINPDNVAGNYMELVMNATNLSNDELERFMKKAYRSFYFRPSYIWKRLKNTNKDEFKTSVLGFISLVKSFFIKK